MANEFKRGIPDGTYDVALDKGTLDSLMCSDDGEKKVKKALHEIDRILKPDGVYIVMSHCPPDVMIPFLDSTDDVADVEDFFSWESEAHQIAKPTLDRNKIIDLFDPANTYFVYVCVKVRWMLLLRLSCWITSACSVVIVRHCGLMDALYFDNPMCVCRTKIALLPRQNIKSTSRKKRRDRRLEPGALK